MAKIVLINGKAASGKTTTARIIKRYLEEKGNRVLITPFAAYLKFICKEYLEWDGKKDEQGRHTLQYVGTDLVRKKNPNFWSNTIVEFIKVFSDEFDYFIIDDCRFPTEVDCFDGFDYITIRVERPDHENHLSPEQRIHESETALDNWAFHIYFANYEGLDILEDNVRKMMFLVPWFSMGEECETTNN
jgi:ABC-type oligopeptide transport system ATPase subunit